MLVTAAGPSPAAASDAPCAVAPGAEVVDAVRLWPGDAPDDRVVHQATGMVAAQMGVSVAEAYVRLRARAFAEGQPLGALARAVVGRRMRFTEDGREGGRDVDTT